MANDCRAKDPSSCRVHGTGGTYEKLKEVADSAASSGDAEAYMNARAEMDKKENPALVLPHKAVPEKAWEAAAKAAWEKGGRFKWKDVSAAEKNELIGQNKLALESAVEHMPNGKITDEAVEAMAISLRNTSGRGNWNDLYPNMKAQYFDEARYVLKSVMPHLKGSLNSKTNIRNMFDKLFG
jgi:hypothetical protein